ncbi:MAG: DegT/DnrJ/EryC1/StrS family aminotransferase [Pedobacter sp.]|nr:MAG: DegT/DnrJ/EryC1/StrS family aminotransferase [Pedobacter sp.]
MIKVTQTFLPDISTYNAYLEGIWKRNHLTNHGPLVLELETTLKKHLGVKHLFLVNNGTIAIQIALKAVAASGDIITTPFSYVATTSSILWEGMTPVFADIDEESLCIDPKKVEELAKKGAKTLLATHVYGNPCDVEELDRIAKKYGIKIIYDAAHAFDVNYKDTSVLNYGDISTLSFHATKLFHTIEGGAIITNDDELAHKIAYMRNFGHNGPEQFFGVGINGKVSEFNAAMGLSVLPHVPSIIEARKKICSLYNKIFKGSLISSLAIKAHITYNFAYYPVFFNTEDELLIAVEKLNNAAIFPRRYFYPALNTLHFVQYQPCPVAESIAKRVLCLPLYFDLKEEEVKLIGNIILND